MATGKMGLFIKNRKLCRTSLAITFMLGVVVLCATSQAMPTQAAPPPVAALDADVLAFVKAAVWIGGAFLAVLAFLGVGFFGWDVRNARDSIVSAQKDIAEAQSNVRNARDSIVSAQKDIADAQSNAKKLSEDLEEEKRSLIRIREEAEELATELQNMVDQVQPPPQKVTPPGRSDIDAIRDVIKESRFEWTSIDQIVKRTGLKEDTIESEVLRKGSDIIRSMGRKSRRPIYKLASSSP